MLDLIVSTPVTSAGVVDYLGKQELVYLGPDEQVVLFFLGVAGDGRCQR
jgi:hypothetical protein